MSTPGGLLRWGQQGRYTAFDDRVVITALAGSRTGVIRPAWMQPAGGLTITVAGGWCAVADCGDGTVAVLAGPVAVQVEAAPGGDQARTDVLVAEVSDPETARWQLSVLPPGARPGVVLGWVHVPPGATSAADMTLETREQDFSTGGAVPGPPGPVGPIGPPGPPGNATLIVGSFSRDPADLPDNGFIEAGWDRPGNPASDTQVMQGWSIIHEPTGNLWQYLGDLFHGAASAWLNIGLIQGPPGERGPEGPQGPPGPATDLGVGPWKLLVPPTLPGGLLAGTRMRYRLLAALNSVQVDFRVQWAAQAPAVTYYFPSMDQDCWPGPPYPLCYANQGNAGNATANTQTHLFWLEQNGGVQWILRANSGAGYAALNAIIPRADPGGEDYPSTAPSTMGGVTPDEQEEP
jgi:hypothetical protein